MLRQAGGAPVANPDDPAVYHSELSKALRLLYERTGQPDDLDEAVTLARQAVEATPIGHSYLPAYHLVLGKALDIRAQAQAGSAIPLDPEQATRSELVAMLAALGDIDTRDALPGVLAPGAVEAATRLAGMLAEDESPDLGSQATLGKFFWFRHLALPKGDQKWAAHDSAISAYLPVFRAGGVVPASLKSCIAQDAADAAIADLGELLLSGPDARLLTEAVTLWRRILDAVPGDHPERAGYTGLLGAAICGRYGVTGHRADLDESVAALQEAIAGVPGDHGLLPMFRMLLGEALSATAAESGGADVLDQAIEAGQQAVREATGEERALSRAQLGWAYVRRYQEGGDPPDLAEGTALLAKAIAALPADWPLNWVILARLSDARQLQFTATGDPALLAEAIDAGRRAVDRSLDGHPDQVACWVTLGTALLKRAQYPDGGDGDLDAAIGLFTRAIERATVDSVARATCEANLGQALLARHSRTGRQADLDTAIESLEHARPVLSPGGGLGVWAASALGRALTTRFLGAGSLADLDEAIAISHQAATSVPAAHAERASYLFDYAMTLQLKFDWTSDPRYFDEGIKAARQAVEAAPAGHPRAPLFQMGLAGALRARAVLAASQPDPGSDAEADDIHPNVTGAGDDGTDADAQITSDIAEAIAWLRQAATAIPPDHMLGAVLLSELGDTLLVRSSFSGDAGDLDAAVAALRQAVATTEGHPTHGDYLYRLAMALETASAQTGRPEYRDEAAALYRATARFPLASAATRIYAARDGAGLAADTDPAVAADLLEVAIRLLPETVSRPLSRADQQHALGQFVFLASEAAEHALIAGGPEAAARALGLLELGRAVLQGQALDIRRDLLDLQAAHPELAVRFTRLRSQLEAADGPGSRGGQASAVGGLMATTQAVRLLEASGVAEAGGRFRAGAEFAALIDQIRSLDGFESFLLQAPPAELIRHASDGPIVTFNVGESRCDALVVTAGAITVVPLPGLAAPELFERGIAWDAALELILHHDLDQRARLDAEGTLSQVLEWLWDVAAEPVLRHLGYLRPPAPGQPWPRVWWATGGLLGLLPIHAAGYHRQQGAAATVLDRVVSSYTPTVRALAYARQRARTTPPAVP